MRQLLLIVLLFINGTVFSQLNGIYTVGGTNPDFPDFVSVLDSLKTASTSDTVKILIRAGIYNGSIQYNGGANTISTNHPVYFQSESGLNDVFITSSANITLELFWKTSVPVQKISFKHINIETTQTIANPTFSYAVKLVNFKADFDSCNFLGSLYLYKWSVPNSIYNISFCTVQCPNRIEFKASGMVEDNMFLSDGFNQNSGTVYYYRNFQQGKLDVITGEIIDNEIDEFWASHSGPYLFSGNKVNGDFNLSFGNGISQIIGNRINGDFNISPYNGSSLKILNNVFKSRTSIDSPNLFILNNTFGPSGYLLTSSSCEIKNNLFSFNGAYYNASVENNNYYRLSNFNPNYNNYVGGQFDSNPYMFNPMFIDTFNLIPTNPSLIGLGVNNSLVIYDIDSIYRPFKPTLGANEICFSSNDTIFMTCGDSIPLSVCSIDSGLFSHWQPSIGLNDSTSIRPYANPSFNTTYIAYDSLNNPMDTFNFIIIPFSLSTELDTVIQCLDSVNLIASFHPNATYSWFPTNGMVDSLNRIAKVRPQVPTDYTVTVSIPGCGTDYDTVSIGTDYLPKSIWSNFNPNNLNVTFNNNSKCYDSLYWNFGNGADTSFLPWFYSMNYLFDTAGTYYVCLIAFNAYGADTLCDSITVTAPIVSVEDIFIKNKILLYPNPTSENITIKTQLYPSKIQIYDGQGRLIRNEKIEFSSKKIILSDLVEGLYYYHLIFENETYSGKFVLK